jgi:competence protein ComEA
MVANSPQKKMRALLKMAFAVGILLSTISIAFAVGAPPKPVLPDGPGKDVVENSCLKCHAPNIIAAKRKTKDDWVQTVGKMRGLGAEVLDDDVDPIATYLVSHFGPWINVNKATEQDFANSFGMTPAEATAMVKYRTDNGEFKTVDDMLKVPAVDAAKIQAQTDNITFKDMPATPDPAPKK